MKSITINAVVVFQTIPAAKRPPQMSSSAPVQLGKEAFNGRPYDGLSGPRPARKNHLRPREPTGHSNKPRAPDDRRAPRVKSETRVYPRAPGRRSSAGTPKSAGPFNRIPRTPPHMNPHEQSYSVVRLFVLGSTSAYTCLKAPNPFALSVRANTVHPPVHQPTRPRIPMMTKKKTREDTEPKRGGTWTTARRPAKRNLFDAGTSPSPI